MITDFFIRIAMEMDIADMQHILLRSKHTWHPRALLDCFGKDDKQWAIFLHSTMLGFVIVKTIADQWDILQIVIDPDYQQQGLGTRLMQHVLTEAHEAHVTKIQLEVRRSNTHAIYLYQKLGFREVGIRKKYYADHEDAILMDFFSKPIF